MRCLSNSNTAGFTAKRAEMASEDYAKRAAMPIMDAIDRMPPAWRALVNAYGYVDVYRACRRTDWQPQQVRHAAERNGGLFVL
jgi:hypothetical protein